MLRLIPLAVLATVSILRPAVAAEVTEFTLENGMPVVVVEDHRSAAVVHMVWYKVGAADEVPGKSGIAHLLEHLMFKGTDTRAPGEFSRIVEANGGSDNAFTSWDNTGYFQRIAADRLPLMMEMEADRMRNLVLTEEITTPELSVVLEERSQRTDSNPTALFREQMRAAQYLNHPYGRPIVGWRHEIEDLTLDDALEFYERHYAPNNAVLIVAGDVDPAEVRELAETTYGKISAVPEIEPRERVSEPPQLAARRLQFEDPRIAQAYVTRSYLAEKRNTGAQEDAAALTLLSDLLGGDQVTSFMGKRLQFDDPKAVYTSTYYNGTQHDYGAFHVTVVPTEEVTLSEIEAEVDAAIAAFIEEGVDPEDLERIKQQYAAADIYAQDDVQGIARRYGMALTTGLTVQDVQEWPAIIQAVTAEDVIAAAKTVFDDSKSVTGWLSPSANAQEEMTQ